MIHIPHIQLELLVPGDGVAAVALGPAGNPRANLVPPRLMRAVEREVLDEKRPRTDERHNPLEHIDELRKLVERGGTHEAADAREALRIRKQVAAGVASVSHRLELQHFEDFSVLARALLREERAGAAVREMQPERHDRQQRPDDRQSGQCNNEVQDSFEEVFVHRNLLIIREKLKFIAIF